MEETLELPQVVRESNSPSGQPARRSAVVTSERTAATAGVLATLALAAMSCVVMIDRMDTMDTGVDTELGSFGYFIATWIPMMAAMVLSMTWMAVVAAVIVGHKLPPAKAAIDVPVALAIVGLGILIVLAPSSVPALTSSM
jgi:hypothetical protein